MFTKAETATKASAAAITTAKVSTAATTTSPKATKASTNVTTSSTAFKESTTATTATTRKMQDRIMKQLLCELELKAGKTLIIFLQKMLN